MALRNGRALTWCGAVAVVVAAVAAAARADGNYFEVTYPPAEGSGGLKVGVTYTMWVPGGATQLRGVIVHQHGCGAPACRGGATAAYDLHWQALARKWDCALMGPSYQQRDDQDCSLWCDPRKGSDETFLRALADLASKSRHPELERAPWCLWGHSGGGTWAGTMLALHPDRVVAAWLRSGAAGLDGPGAVPVPDAAYSVPVMCNPGAKEKDDKRFHRAWEVTLATFKAYRAHGAPIGFAPDPRTGHECGDSRYLAIPFFDACLSMRLPDNGGGAGGPAPLRPVDTRRGWLATPLEAAAEPAESYKGDAAAAMWLPNEAVAKAWEEYVKTGAVRDATAPPAPSGVRVTAGAGGGVTVTWDAAADPESGLKAFVVLRDGRPLAQVPEQPAGKFGRPLFQAMSFHDTPEAPLPEMRYVDRSPGAGPNSDYCVVSVNGVGLKSEPSPLAVAAP